MNPLIWFAIQLSPVWVLGLIWLIFDRGKR